MPSKREARPAARVTPRPRHVVALVLVTLAATMTAACAFTPVSSLTITPGSVTLPLVAADGGAAWPSATLTASFQPGVPADAIVTWTSADPSVATVSPGGVVEGVAPGRTAVTATFGSATATAEVCVGGEIESVTLSPEAGERVAREYTATATVDLSCDQDPATAPVTYRWNCSSSTGSPGCSAAVLAAGNAGSGSPTIPLAIGDFDEVKIEVEVCVAGRCTVTAATYSGIPAR